MEDNKLSKILKSSSQNLTKGSSLNKIKISEKDKNKICSDLLESVNYKLLKKQKKCCSCKILQEIVKLTDTYITGINGMTTIETIPEYNVLRKFIQKCSEDSDTKKGLNFNEKISDSNWCKDHDRTKNKIIKSKSMLISNTQNDKTTVKTNRSFN